MKKIFTNAILTLALIVGASVSSALAETIIDLAASTEPDSGEGWSSTKNPELEILIFTVTGDVTFTGTSNEAQIFVPKDASAKITLDNVIIKNAVASPLIVESDRETNTGGSLELTLVGENELIAAQARLNAAAVRVEDSAEITIKGDGQLKAYGAGVKADVDGVSIGGGAGIGSNSGRSGTYWASAGKINIQSGIILAQGGYNASGIGGGYCGDNSETNITGGTIFTTSIGAGSHGAKGIINVGGDATIYMNWSLGAKVDNTDANHPKYNDAVSINHSGKAKVFAHADDAQYFSKSTTTISGDFQYYVFDDQGLEGRFGASVVLESFFSHDDADRDAEDTDFENALVTLYGGNINLNVPDGEVWVYGTVVVPEYLTIDGYNELSDANIIIRLLGDDARIVANGDESVEYNDVEVLNAGDDYGYVYNAILTKETAVATIGESTLKLSLENDELSVDGAAVTGLTIYSVSGQTLISTAASKVSVASLPKGVYIVSIATETGKVSAKFVK